MFFAIHIFSMLFNFQSLTIKKIFALIAIKMPTQLAKYIICLDQWLSNSHEPWPPSKFNWRILNMSWHLGYAISRQRGGEGPVWETLV